ncbi:MAG: Arc family DNA-binding protein [Roseburia sp.]|nr:Arc family DNA-binding protein [Roseburia sp.]MCM1097825.1 Arc family DNA-binding protein [Ruminococcus flavefaciens]
MVTTMRLPDELHEDLKKQAERKGMTFNAYLLSILWEVYKKDELNHNRQERG